MYRATDVVPIELVVDGVPIAGQANWAVDLILDGAPFPTGQGNRLNLSGLSLGWHDLWAIVTQGDKVGFARSQFKVTR